MILHEQRRRIPYRAFGQELYFTTLYVYTNMHFFVIFMSFTELLLIIWTELFECSRTASTAGSRQPALKLHFYYFSLLLNNWEVSYLFWVFDLLTQPNKTLLCCSTTKSAVHFQPPNKWLAWFIWVISSVWRGPASLSPMQGASFRNHKATLNESITAEARWSLEASSFRAAVCYCISKLVEISVETHWNSWRYSDSWSRCFIV